MKRGNVCGATVMGFGAWQAASPWHLSVGVCDHVGRGGLSNVCSGPARWACRLLGVAFLLSSPVPSFSFLSVFLFQSVITQQLCSGLETALQSPTALVADWTSLGRCQRHPALSLDKALLSRLQPRVSPGLKDVFGIISCPTHSKKALVPSRCHHVHGH